MIEAVAKDFAQNHHFVGGRNIDLEAIRIDA
jgi:hypothetical protein